MLLRGGSIPLLQANCRCRLYPTHLRFTTSSMMAFVRFVHKELGLEGDGEDLADICAGTDPCCPSALNAALGSSQERIQAGEDLYNEVYPPTPLFIPAQALLSILYFQRPSQEQAGAYNGAKN